MTFKLGRNQPKSRLVSLHLKNYLLRALPVPPPTINYTNRTDNPLLSNILNNDNYGDCTIAGAFHIAATLLANAEMPPDPNLNADTCLRLYLYLTGGADNGLDENIVLNYWQQHGLFVPIKHKPHVSVLPNHRITGFAAVDPHDPVSCMTALWLFENLYFGLSLPDAWINPFPSADGFVWDVAGDPNPEQGHCFVGLGYDTHGVTIDTWGLVGSLTWSAISEYCDVSAGGQLFTVLSQDAIDAATQKAPAGFAFAQLQADLQALM